MRMSTGFQEAGKLEMMQDVERVDEVMTPLDPLQNEMRKKIRFVSKIVLFMAIVGFSTYALFELFWGLRHVFYIGLITSGTLIISLIFVFF